MSPLRHVNPKVQGITIFVVGIVGIVAELIGHLFLNRSADPTLTLVFAAMLGLPAMLRAKNGEYAPAPTPETATEKASA